MHRSARRSPRGGAWARPSGRVDCMAFPRLCAFAEAVWSSSARDYPGFAARLAEHLERLDALGVNYRPPGGPRPWDARPDAPGFPQTLAERLAPIEEMVAPATGTRVTTLTSVSGSAAGSGSISSRE